MSQHDNGRRAMGGQAGAWQQDPRERPDAADPQQGQFTDARWSRQGGGQHGGHHERGPDRGHPQRRDDGRGQRGEPPAAPRWGDNRGGQGSFGGQASDNDYGNRGITESGNFGNYGREEAGPDDARGSSYRGAGRDEGQAAYRHGYDARGDAGGAASFGGPGNEPQGQQGAQTYHDADYRRWRDEQIARLDRDYEEWRRHRYQRFSEDFDQWRSARANAGSASGSAGAQPPSGIAPEANGPSGTNQAERPGAPEPGTGRR